MSELKRRLFKVVGDSIQSEPNGAEPIEEVRDGIAQLLKQTRERYGQSLRDVSANLRIRMAYLQAIEGGRFRELPGPTYAVGFVRSYAEYLGLDAAEIVRRFKGEVEGLDNKTHLAFPEPVPEGKVPGGAIIIVSLLVLVVGYGGWYAITSRDAGNTLIPRLSEGLKSLVGNEDSALEQVPAPSTPASPTAATPEPPISATPVAEAGSEPVAEPQGATGSLVSPAGTAELPTPAAEAEEPEAAATGAGEQEVAVGSTEEDEGAAPAAGEDAPLPEAGLPAAPAIPVAPRAEATAALQPSEAGAAPPSAGEGQVVLHARLASWVQVTDASGQPIVTRTLLAGESLDVPFQPGLTLFTGNAGGLEILVDGQPLPALGPVGAVRRGISLDPDALRRGQE